MYKIINQKGEIFRIDAAHIYSEKQSHKGSQSSPHTFEVKNLALSIILTLPEFAGFSVLVPMSGKAAWEMHSISFPNITAPDSFGAAIPFSFFAVLRRVQVFRLLRLLR